MFLSAIASLTIIVPVFNEEDCLYPFSEVMNGFLAQSPVPTQVLFVDDGSTGSSLRLIRELCHLNPAYEYLSLDGNYGLSTAFKAGIDQATITYIGYIDADLQASQQSGNLL
jgi:dolichol-phosphate mannosyltransferase